MNDLQQKVQAMIEGENRRRDIALKWVKEIEQILLPVAVHIWGEDGDGGDGVPGGSVWIRNYSETKKKNICIDAYFRYASIHQGSEGTGFYVQSFGIPIPCDGERIEYKKGYDFWSTIEAILKWLPIVIEAIDKRSASRDALLKKIN